MGHYGESGIVQVDPVRDLAICDYINMADPWSILDQRTNGISQLLQ